MRSLPALLALALAAPLAGRTTAAPQAPPPSAGAQAPAAGSPSPPGTEAPADTFPRGELVENVACRTDPTQTYTLYLPTGYRPESDPGRRWPALLVFDPRRRGTVAAEIFRAAAERSGWLLLSSNDTLSDGPMEPNVKALRALWPEVHERFAVDPQRVYAAGFSGGAIVAWMLAQETHQLAGIVASGGRLPAGIPTDRIDVAHFGTAGVHDFNFLEMKRIDALLEDRGAPHRLERFAGRHQWLSPELAAEAIGWMELVAMQSGRREKDEAWIATERARELARGRDLEAQGQPLAALRVDQTAARTFAGLADVRPFEEGIARLAQRPDVRRAERDEDRWDRFELEEEASMAHVLHLLDDPSKPVTSERLAADLHLPALQRRAAAGGYPGDAAQRVLEQIATQTGFYLTRDALAQGSYERARLLLTIAVRIHADNPVTWYNLACAEARTGHRDAALAALGKAFAAGYTDVEHTRTDADLATLRDDPRFATLLARAANAG